MKNEIDRTLQHIKDGNIIVYPTDTIWGLGCDATNQSAVEKVYEIKNRSESKSLIILVDSIEMLETYIETVPELIRVYIETATKPTTVIYAQPQGLASNVVAKDDTVAIRIVKNDFCKALIKSFGKPIVSTSANISNQPSPSNFNEIDPLLLEKADYIVNLPAVETKKTASQIIKLNDLGEIEYLRK
ncbi:L-threonylcarbamoyladenylate synthase [Lutimonas halocynthiae]|uniref:L-threonylcarbamoyladenylate synthase n=1 Tax=Lutimonas halocynthiae TaxID=1446477 RepID=UPI0025B3E0DD|nr:L-threonylcarbamoyladenylate synthase [Lutimonas halocynthiae]MDN3644436.1 L-threonylcarbamoyladenylate synthase [Lutimonas halocynthiae]